MAVFKATKNKKKIDEEEQGVFKATANKSTDISIIKGVENNISNYSEKINEYVTRRNEGKYISSKDIDLYRDIADRYKNERNRYNSLLKNYGGTYDPDAENEHLNWLSSVRSDMDTSYDYFSKFKSEDDYNKFDSRWLTPYSEDDELYYDPTKVDTRKGIYEGNKAKIAELEAKIAKASKDKKKSLETEKKRLEEENRQYERTQGKADSYSYIYGQKDFEKGSENRDFKLPTRDDLKSEDIRMDSSTWYTDANGTTYNALGEVVAENDIYGIKWDSKHTGTYYLKNKASVDRLGLYLSTDKDAWGDAAGNNGTWEDIINAGIHGNWEQLREEEIDAYYYLLNTEGYEAADKYLDDMTYELNRRATEEYNENLTELFEDANPLMRAALNVASVPASWLGSISAGIEDTFNLVTGNDINKYSSAHSAGNFGSQVRGLQAEEWDDISIPFIDFSLGDAYQGIMSGLDSLAATATGTQAATFILGSASDKMTDQWEKGATRGEVGALGAIAGGAEYFSEKLAIDNLFKIGDSKTLGQFFVNVLKQGGVEYAEEALTEATNILADAVIKQGASDWNKLLEANNGNVFAALKEELKQINKAGLSGFVSGSAMGAVKTGAETIAYKDNVNQHGQNIIDNKGYDDLKALALSMSEEASGIKSLDKAIKKAETKTTATNVGRLSEQVEAIKGEQNVADIQSALVDRGMSKRQAQKTALQILEVAQKQTEGVEITPAEYESVTKNEVVSEVYRSLISDTDSSINTRNLKHSNERQGIKVNEDGTVTSSEGRTSRIMDRVVQEVALENISSKSRFKANTGIVEETDDDIADAPMTAEDAMAYKGKTTYTNPETRETKIVDIEGVSKIENGEMTLKLKGGETVNASDVRFASEGEALVYSTVVDMGVNAGVAEALVNEFKASGVSAGKYALGIKDAYIYGRENMPLNQLSKSSFAYQLSDAQRQYIYKLGQTEAKAETKANQQAIDTKRAAANKKGTVKAKSGKVIAEDGVAVAENGEIDESSLTDVQKASLVGVKALAELSPINFHVFQSKKVNGKWVATINGEVVEGSPNGVYFKGTNDIWIDLNAGDMGEGTMLWTAAHEISHYIRERSPAKWKAMADFLMKEYAKKGVSVSDMLDKQKSNVMARADAGTKTEIEIADEAYEDLVSNALSDMLTDGSIINSLAELKQQNKGLWETIKKAVADLLKRWGEILGVYQGRNLDAEEAQALAGMEKAYKKLQKMYAEAFAEANVVEEAINIADVTGETDLDGNKTEHKLSVRSMVEGAGLRFVPTKMDGKRVLEYKIEDKYGNAVDKVDKGMIKNSPLGNLVAAAVNGEYISESDADEQYKFLAELVNMCLQYKDTALVWETAGTLVFSAIKSNADKQYGKTIDFSTVCKKTQAIVDAMSEAMLRLGRGLTRAEVETIYLEVGKAGEETPCPVCYVFSRWMGIGGILDQMYRFQTKYVPMSDKSIRAFMEDIENRINERAYTPGKTGKLKPDFFDSKGNIKQGQVIADLKSKASSKAASALKELAKNSDNLLQIQELEALMEGQTEKGKKATLKKIAKLKASLVDVSAVEATMKEANDIIEEYEAYQWLTRTLMTQDEGSGKWIRNEKFKSVPKEVIFDLNKGDDFASGYPLSWAFRTGKGASAGKAITPYADARVGETIQGIAKSDIKDIKTGLDLNPFLNGDEKTQSKLLETAREKQKKQNLIGGQRYQSTSDFRYEYGSDYLITFLEMQAIGAKVQLYTKVIEAVDFLASVGAECNLSVMPLSDGFITLEDGTKKLVYSSVTGINGEAAIQKSKQYDNVQLILVGISDEHIRLALEGTEVTFVIPFHGSGQSVHQIAALMNLLKENLDVTTAKDYTAVQSDHDVLKPTKKQKAAGELRIKIITGEAGTITAAEHQILEENKFLKDLYRRFYLDENAEEYGVSLSKDQAKQIFPYEYWDKSLTYAEADENGRRFMEYCESIGKVPRFSGVNSKGEQVGFGDFTKDKGYWKLLIDRRMYNNVYDENGNWTGYGDYHNPKTIDVSNFKAETIDPEWGTAHYGNVMAKKNDPKKTNAIVDAALAQIQKPKAMHSDRNKAPTFYSHMGKVIDGIKTEKIGAGGVVPYLKGKGVKNEEIKWSGIEAFLEGKKSLTKKELQEFVAGSMLQIEEEMPNDTRWDQYTLEGGENYREIVFTLPESAYTNRAMKGHWGQDAKGILVHARIQDFEVDGQKMLFVEELQSDWHNEGHSKGYSTKEYEEAVANRDELYNKYKNTDSAFHKYVRSNDFRTDTEDVRKKKHDWLRRKVDTAQKNYLDAEKVVDSLKEKGMGDVTDAPFKDTYHEYVMKRLVRMAAEEGYDIIGWTPAEIQVDRWSEDYAEGYRIEYDQDIPKFMNKYGKKWGTKVEKTKLPSFNPKESYYDVNREETYDSFIEWQETVRRELKAQGAPMRNVMFILEGDYWIAYNKADGTEYDRAKVNKTSDSVWSMPITDSMKDSVLYEGQALYSERNTDSNRSLLANALETTVQNDAEAQKLAQYKEKIALIDAEQQKLAEINAQIKELSFSKGKRDAEKLKSLRFDAVQAANRINTFDRQLLNLESTKVLKAVLQREKGLAMKRQKQKNAEALKEYRGKVVETRDKRDAVKKLQKLVLDTAKWVSYPAKEDVKVPDILKAPYADFLESIDLSSKRSLKGGEATQNDMRIASAMNSLATAIEQIKTAQNPTADTKDVSSDALDAGYLDLPVNFIVNLRKMAENITKMMIPGTFVVNSMSAQDVKQISKLIRTLNHSIKEMSTMYSNLRFSHVEEAGNHTVEFLNEIGEAKSTNAVADFVSWDNALPYYAFKRFGEAGESIFEELMDAQDKLAFLADVIFKFKEKNWTDKEARAWGEDTRTIQLPSGNEITLTTADAMGIYCLSRREQAVPHLLGGGIRVVGQTKGAKKASDSRSTLTMEDLTYIASSLSKRQRAVAEAIQEFMSSTCSEWGNEISMKRFLTKEFREKYYYPIESSDENLPVKDKMAQQADLYRLLNISATKPLTKGANNAVIIRNIFEVFTNHASDMAKLNAYGMALLDYMKWVNFREKSSNEQGQITTRGVRQAMNSTYGDKAFSYVLNLIKDVNGRYNDGGDHAWLMKMTRSAKTASVGNSLRVAVLQVTAYPRAGLVLSQKSLALGLTKKPQIKKAQKYCGIALWKSFGFYDTNIARSLEDQIKGNTNIKQKLIEWSLKGAEIGDALTWGVLWNACEYEVSRTNKSLKAGSEEFNQAVGKKLREVVYATQVVDSILTRSQIMRNKSGLTQSATAFMSEPTVSANILMDAGFQFRLEQRRTGSVKAAWKKTGKHIGKAIAIYSVGQLTAAVVESLADAYRDDDDEEFYKKFLEAFRENAISDLMPFNKIPIISDIAEFVLSRFNIGFFSSDNLATTWLSQAANAYDTWVEVLSGDTSKTLYNAIYNTTRALSSATGVAGAGLMREVVALWNNTAGAADSTLKIKTYENSDAENGMLALEALIEGDEKQAESLRNEFEDDDTYVNAVRKAIGNKYKSGEFDYDTAYKWLVRFVKLKKDEDYYKRRAKKEGISVNEVKQAEREDSAYWQLDKWDYELETGATEGYEKYADFITAVETGKNLKKTIEKYLDNGVSEDTLAGQITEYFKPIYREMSKAERTKLKGYLLNAYELLGKKRGKKSEDINDWLKDK